MCSTAPAIVVQELTGRLPSRTKIRSNFVGGGDDKHSSGSVGLCCPFDDILTDKTGNFKAALIACLIGESVKLVIVQGSELSSFSQEFGPGNNNSHGADPKL